MSDEQRDIVQAERTARDARLRLHATLGEIQQRLSPRTLADDAWRGVRHKGADLAEDTVSLVRRHPVETGAAAAVAVGLLARRPLWRAISRLFSRREETPALPAGLNDI